MLEILPPLNVLCFANTTSGVRLVRFRPDETLAEVCARNENPAA